MIVLYAQDQLRQRVAWALSQIYAISPEEINDFARSSEHLITYYDIFVKHAFGNLLDILRDVSYSPVMGQMLGHVGSRSGAYIWRRESQVSFADENYAREVMQLFSVGLIMLNLDGTPITDTDGNVIETYSNVDITSYAKAWTGFNYQLPRGNIEDRGTNANRLDPMRLIADYRDPFPKTDLNNGFIGDKYPLCVDFPQNAFLSKGSTYRLLGSSPVPDLFLDTFRTPETSDYVVLQSSDLYEALCNKNAAGECQFDKVSVTLPDNLRCSGIECDVDTLRVVQVGEMYFEYVRPPCVQLSFYKNPRTIRGRSGSWGSLCANPLLPEASEACCETNRLTRAYRNCAYVGERLTAATAADRCVDGLVTCDFTSVRTSDINCDRHLDAYHWRNGTCSIQVKVQDTGQVSLVHAPTDTIVEPNLQQEASNFFSVQWSGNRFPTSASGCGLCTTLTTGECLCDTELVERSVFRRLPSSATSVLNRLYIAVSENQFDSTLYTNTMEIDENLKAYYGSECCDEATVFQVTEARTGRSFLLKNLESRIYLSGEVDDPISVGRPPRFSFRNPPHFLSFNRYEMTVRDSQYETEAVLESYFYHGNVAPFIGLRLCQRFGFSNPSPSFLERVATAFQTGTYTSGGLEFGTGNYGDLAATVAAILLDEEATTDYLEMDPTYGSLQEPLLKYLKILRSMELKTFDQFPFVELDRLEGEIGQMAHEIPSVFSFFLPEYAPPGAVSNAGLTAPEAQILTTPKTIALMNGMYSVFKAGLTDCDGGLSTNVPGNCRDSGEGIYEVSTAKLEYVPPSNIDTALTEIYTLLTSGRMTAVNAATIKSAVETVAAEDYDKAVRLAQQLTVSSPEFHGTSIPLTTSTPRPQLPDPSPPQEPYKAVIHFMLSGGMDSYQLLVPHSGCTGTDMYAQYADIRGSIALPKSSLNQISTTGQICSTFGLHPNFPFLRDLYDSGDALFVANAGVMTKDVNADNYRDETITNLFAHNAMRGEIKTLDPYVIVPDTAPLGRFADAVVDNFGVRAVSIDTNVIGLTGRIDVAPPVYSIDRGGITPYNEEESIGNMTTVVRELNGQSQTGTGLYVETFSKVFMEAIDQTKLLSEILDTTDVTTIFPITTIGRRLELLAKVMKSREAMGIERDVFYVEMGGFDTHAAVENRLEDLFTALNDALEKFVIELRDEQGIWDSVTIIETSDFARTLTPNGGLGTDHAWGGHMFIAGGSVDGGKILGEFPTDMTTEGTLNVGRGRLIPTTPFDSAFNAVAEWFGIPEEKLIEVLPNRNSFTARPLLTQADVFEM